MESLSLIARDHYLKRTLCTYCVRRISTQRSKYTFLLVENPLLQNGRSTPKRTFGTKTYSALNQEALTSQAHPLKGYYSDILSKPTHISNPVLQDTSKNPTPPPPSSPSQQSPETREPTPEERMSIVFGTRLAGPGYSSRYNPSTPPDATWQTINGVPVPPRPTEPDNCCMSGCVHCVWDDYRDDIEEWAARVREAKSRQPRMHAAPQKGDVKHKPRREVQSASKSMDDDGGGSESNWDSDSLSTAPEDLFEGIPVGIREFMRIEKRLKEKKKSLEG